MKRGDDVILTESGTGLFTHYAQVITKTENRALGEAIWPFVGESPCELIYFLRNVRRITVPKPQLVVALQYQPTYNVSGPVRVGDERLAKFEETHGSIVEWLGVAAGSDDLGDVEDPDEDFTGVDFQAPSKRRRGHQKFAERVKRNYGHACATCGISEDRFLVAGHIIGWAEDPAHRLNPANGICLCLLHDRAFEAGYISLDDQLRVVLSSQIEPDSRLGAILKAAEGQPIRIPFNSPPDPRLLGKHRERLLR